MFFHYLMVEIEENWTPEIRSQSFFGYFSHIKFDIKSMHIDSSFILFRHLLSKSRQHLTQIWGENFNGKLVKTGVGKIAPPEK